MFVIIVEDRSINIYLLDQQTHGNYNMSSINHYQKKSTSHEDIHVSMTLLQTISASSVLKKQWSMHEALFIMKHDMLNPSQITAD